ncbi:MAG: 2-succinyl-5-enolpyruvyl-6-hydroxy-3-cyclohexene-1-carboxylic-acid synthase [Candidatus Marinimicrobia bacterium]|nr:2-succinyl-5-enolpyruvyl-6-hydroxy-3-cyclohexene-1-carboxylic-acid synthase [Candidatus Neomarinimicrobiota bacterium]
MTRQPGVGAVNALWGRTIVDQLHRLGVRHACISPGYRNAPVSLAFAHHQGFEIHTHIDERSGGFFGLGIGKMTGAPAVILCTSGTAAVNFYPSVVEAYYSGTPLIVLTTDRPPELRQVGANQTIDQIKLFGDHVRFFAEVTTPDLQLTGYLRQLINQAYSQAIGAPAGPVHLNIPFREPLTPPKGEPGLPFPATGDATGAEISKRVWQVPDLKHLSADIRKHRHGALVVGPMPPTAGFSQALRELSIATGYPVLAEGASQVRYASEIHGQAIENFDILLGNKGFQELFQPEVMIRIGARPTSKAFTGILARHPGRLYVISASGLWDDPDRQAGAVYAADPTGFCRALATEVGSQPADENWLAGLRKFDRQAQEVIRESIAPEAPFFEGHVSNLCVQLLPEDGVLYVGNSMPVRDLETFALAVDRSAPLTVLSNRGASGIDGMVSSALGAAMATHRPVLLYLGDMSFLHDLGGLAAATEALNLTIVVVNNNGGGIFSYLPLADESDSFTRLFTMPHGLTFRSGAELFGLGYSQASSYQETRQAIGAFLHQPGVQIVEVAIDQQVNVARHRAVHEALARRLKS